LKFRWPFARSDRGEPFKVFDPRRGDDFKFGPLDDGSVVSSRDRNLAVIQVGRAFWLQSSLRVRAAALSCLQLNGGKGFACAFATPRHVEDALPGNAKRGKEGLLSHFAATPDGFRSAFSLFEALEYGELTIGRSVDEFGAGDLGAKEGSGSLRAEEFDLLFVVQRLKNVDWFVSFYADTGDALIGLADVAQLDCLVRKLREGG